MEDALQYSLQTLGFRFNPFKHLEASQDPHLSEYLVGHHSFNLVNEQVPAVVLAPPGAGKTAMLIYTARSCALAFGRNRPFPIMYALPEAIGDTSQELSLDQHQAHILRRGATSLFTGLAFHPECFLNLTAADQYRVTGLLRGLMQTPPLDYYLGLLSTGNPQRLANRFDRSYTFLPLPTPQHVKELCSALKNASQTADATRPSLKDFAIIVQEILKFQKIFVLVDGIDGFAGSANNPLKAAELINPLLEQTMDWAGQDLIIKGFFPPEVASYLAFPGSIQSILLDWTSDKLAQVLRRRVYCATDGQFETLDALCNIGLRGLENTLAEVVIPLPREIIWLANRLLLAFEQRHGAGGETLLKSDLDQAIEAYQTQGFAVRAT